MSNRWSRLELSYVSTQSADQGERTVDLSVGLQARIADPVWILARQRQMGEFQGEDAASPIQVQVEGESIPLTGWRPQAGGQARPNASALPNDLSVPLETRVEQSPVMDGPARVGLAAEMGSHLARLLRDADLASTLSNIIQRYPIAPPTEPMPVSRRARLSLLARKFPDGIALLRALRSEGVDLANSLASSAAESTAVRETLSRWLAWANNWIREPEGTDSWIPERLEYAVGLTAETKNTQIELTALEYPGGRLDWWAFDMTRHQIPTRSDLARFSTTVLPTPLEYAGMPAQRWWEMEAGHVHFGDIDAEPDDLARVLVAQFATVGADDWYIIPIRLPFNSMSRVRSLQVTDTFGRTTSVPSAVQIDERLPKSTRPWRFLELSGQPGPGSPWLLLLAATASLLEGRSIERTQLRRDEGANVAWAVERLIEGPDGRPIDRDAEWRTQRPLPPTPPEDSATWQYRLESTVPPHWVPLVPVRPTISPSGALRRGRMAAWSTMPPSFAPGVRGTVLAGPAPRTIDDQEVPVEGVEVVRRWQLARSADGGVHLWLGREKGAGYGRINSGLVYDQVEQSEQDS